LLHNLRGLAIRTISGTPLEHVARQLYKNLNLGGGTHDDRLMLNIMRRVIPADGGCIDIGCYRGEVLRDMLTLAPQGQHFAFEPIPDNYQFLVKTFPSTKVFNVALSANLAQQHFSMSSTGRPAAG